MSAACELRLPSNANGSGRLTKCGIRINRAMRNSEAGIMDWKTAGQIFAVIAAPIVVLAGGVAVSRYGGARGNPTRSITLTEEETTDYEDGGSIGDAFRRKMKRRAQALANEHDESVEIYSADGVTFEHISPE